MLVSSVDVADESVVAVVSSDVVVSVTTVVSVTEDASFLLSPPQPAATSASTAMRSTITFRPFTCFTPSSS